MHYSPLAFINLEVAYKGQKHRGKHFHNKDCKMRLTNLYIYCIVPEGSTQYCGIQDQTSDSTSGNKVFSNNRYHLLIL